MAEDVRNLDGVPDINSNNDDTAPHVDIPNGELPSVDASKDGDIPTPEKTFTQADVDKIIAQRLKRDKHKEIVTKSNTKPQDDDINNQLVEMKNTIDSLVRKLDEKELSEQKLNIQNELLTQGVEPKLIDNLLGIVSPDKLKDLDINLLKTNIVQVVPSKNADELKQEQELHQAELEAFRQLL